jgi:DNA mismatch repair ATPase MutS
LSEEFENISTVKMMMMDYLISDEKIVFLYKLNKGKSGQSFGINVAKVVKIPNEIIELAKVKAKAME